MEQADIEARLKCAQKLEQRSLSLWKLECEQPLVLSIASTTHEISDVRFGEFVAAEISSCHAVVFQALHQIRNISCSSRS